MIAVEDTVDPLIDYLIYAKEMYNTTTRKAYFHRHGFGYHPFRRWHLTDISMAETVSESPNPNTVHISRLQILKNNNGQDTTLLDTQDPLSTILDRESLLTFDRGDSAKVFVTLDSPDPAVGLLHYRLHRRFPHLRRSLHDDGAYPDEIAGDGIYSGSWRIGLFPGVYHACFDMIDEDTIFDDEAPYDANAWSMPYRVVR
jgi:hypothetical protein